MPGQLATLASGYPVDKSRPLGQILGHFESTIDLLMEEIRWVREEASKNKLAVYGPVLGRNILEICLSAVVARFDPFRVLILRKLQGHKDYDVAKPHKSSLRWQGDILANEKSSAELWSVGKEPEKYSRALLADYWDDVSWRDAYIAVIDSLEPSHTGDWFDRLRNVPADSFVARTRDEASRLFSSLSKGIHPEFVIPISSVYDRDTVMDLLADTIRVSATAALVSNYVDHVPFALSPEDALDKYQLLQKSELQ